MGMGPRRLWQRSPGTASVVAQRSHDNSQRDNSNVNTSGSTITPDVDTESQLGSSVVTDTDSRMVANSTSAGAGMQKSLSTETDTAIPDRPTIASQSRAKLIAYEQNSQASLQEVPGLYARSGSAQLLQHSKRFQKAISSRTASTARNMDSQPSLRFDDDSDTDIIVKRTSSTRLRRYDEPPMDPPPPSVEFTTSGNSKRRPILAPSDKEGSGSMRMEPSAARTIHENENNNANDDGSHDSSNKHTNSFAQKASRASQFVRGWSGKIVNNYWVQLAIVLLIIINAMQMGVATFPFVQNDPAMMHSFDLVDEVFLIVFTIELGFQFIYHGLHLFMDGWLLFDFLIVVLSWSLQSLQIVRAFRIFRAFRLITVRFVF
jgi:hypothetical protein